MNLKRLHDVNNDHEMSLSGTIPEMKDPILINTKHTKRKGAHRRLLLKKKQERWKRVRQELMQYRLIETKSYCRNQGYPWVYVSARDKKPYRQRKERQQKVSSILDTLHLLIIDKVHLYTYISYKRKRKRHNPITLEPHTREC